MNVNTSATAQATTGRDLVAAVGLGGEGVAVGVHPDAEQLGMATGVAITYGTKPSQTPVVFSAPPMVREPPPLPP